MSWDVFIFKAPPHANLIDELPKDYEPPVLAAASDVRQRLVDSFRDVDLSDPAWGHLTGPTWSIELNIGSDDPVDSIMLHVRGGSADVLTVIARIAACVGGRALDTSTGEFLSGHPAESTGWHGFRKYRDQVLCDG
ncbi:hypothetical protein [Micromonospora sp. NPDC023633]|uniref:hypothetical protein n=1 Tax=Micromonospora sp. NPDC023633 TaxID=3154320 RepID=UPI0033D579B4